MRSTPFIHLLTSSAYITYAVADSCCWSDYWAENNWLWLNWDESAGAVKCGLSGPLYPGTKCSVENSKDSDGNIQALTNVTFGNDTQPFKFRIGIDPSSCKTLPDDKVVTGWEGWGAYLFKNHDFNEEPLNRCVQDNSA
ncbi:hypothetical protein CH35J_001055 [Colletotrichum higginsianum]|uniref:Secreted protein n=1 Tax=Colletotrichum higginsianum TaxID=80884 RepID=A0A4T0WKK8_9PEZI|nr:hypothetical protein CH35J_001055 [Colletotrichum higginsianum]